MTYLKKPKCVFKFYQLPDCTKSLTFRQASVLDRSPL